MMSKTDRENSTWSSLLTATAMWRIPSSLAIAEWRRVCGSRMPSTTRVASIRITAASAVLAPVTMLRVYCSWPGVSAMMNFRLPVAK